MLTGRSFYCAGSINWIANLRTKSQTLTGQNSFIPAKLPPVLSKLIDLYLVKIIPFKKRLAELLLPESAVSITLEYFCVQQGIRVDAEDFHK